MKSVAALKITQFAFVALSATCLAQGASAREGLAQRLKKRHQVASVVVQQDGTPAVQWKDGQVSPVVKTKEGLQTTREIPGTRLKQSNGQPIRVVPVAK